MIFDFLIQIKKENFFSPSVYLFKVYRKVDKFSFTQQKIFWVLVFSCIRIWYLAYPMDRSIVSIIKLAEGSKQIRLLKKHIFNKHSIQFQNV